MGSRWNLDSSMWVLVCLKVSNTFESLRFRPLWAIWAFCRVWRKSAPSSWKWKFKFDKFVHFSLCGIRPQSKIAKMVRFRLSGFEIERFFWISVQHNAVYAVTPTLAIPCSKHKFHKFNFSSEHDAHWPEVWKNVCVHPIWWIFEVFGTEMQFNVRWVEQKYVFQTFNRHFHHEGGVKSLWKWNFCPSRFI
jgi:hypothetical protein